MALIKCKECKGQVSTGAKACPHCGTRSFKSKLAIRIVAALLSIPFALAILSKPAPDQSQPGKAAGSSDARVVGSTVEKSVPKFPGDWWIMEANTCSNAKDGQTPNSLLKNSSCKIIRHDKKNGLLLLDCRKTEYAKRFVFAKSEEGCLKFTNAFSELKESISEDQIFNLLSGKGWWIANGQTLTCFPAVSFLSPEVMMQKNPGCRKDHLESDPKGMLVLDCRATNLGTQFMYARSIDLCEKLIANGKSQMSY